MTNTVLIGVALNIGLKLLRYEKVRAKEMHPTTQSSQCVLGEVLCYATKPQITNTRERTTM